MLTYDFATTGSEEDIKESTIIFEEAKDDKVPHPINSVITSSYVLNCYYNNNIIGC